MPTSLTLSFFLSFSPTSRNIQLQGDISKYSEMRLFLKIRRPRESGAVILFFTVSTITLDLYWPYQMPSKEREKRDEIDIVRETEHGRLADHSRNSDGNSALNWQSLYEIGDPVLLGPPVNRMLSVALLRSFEHWISFDLYFFFFSPFSLSLDNFAREIRVVISFSLNRLLSLSHEPAFLRFRETFPFSFRHYKICLRSA